MQQAATARRAARHGASARARAGSKVVSSQTQHQSHNGELVEEPALSQCARAACPSSASARQTNPLADAMVLPSDIDLLHPTAELEKQKHKLKRLVQSPNSFFMDVKCAGCFNMCVDVGWGCAEARGGAPIERARRRRGSVRALGAAGECVVWCAPLWRPLRRPPAAPQRPRRRRPASSPLRLPCSAPRAPRASAARHSTWAQREGERPEIP